MADTLDQLFAQYHQAREAQSSSNQPFDPIEPLLATLGHRSSHSSLNLEARYGPYANKNNLGASASNSQRPAYTLPFVEPQRDRLLYGLYSKLLGQCGSDVVLLPNPYSESLPPLPLDEQVDFIRKHGWSLTKAQRAIPASRAQAARASAIAKGKGPAYPSSSSSSSSSPSPCRAASPLPAASSALDLGPEYAEERRGLPCGHVFAKGEAIWRCRDCSLDETCVQCAPCFQASIHNAENHDVVFSVCASSGGCCDCGDEEAWVKDVGCSYHSISATKASSGDADMDSDATQQQQPQDESSFSSLEIPAATLAPLLQKLPSDAHLNLQRTFATWLDFILSVLDHAPSEQKLFPPAFASTGVSQAAMKQVLGLKDLGQWVANARSDSDQEETLDAAMKSYQRSWQPPGAFHDASEDTEMEFDDATWASKTTRPKKYIEFTADDLSVHRRRYALILWNDEKHSFREVIDVVKEAMNVDEAEARAVAERVDKHGRDILAITSGTQDLVHRARKMSVIGLAVTIRPAFDVFCEEIAHHLIALIKDFSEAVVYLPSETQGALQLTAEASIPKLLVTSALLAPWPMSSRPWQKEAEFPRHMSKAWHDAEDLNKMDGMLLLDQKLWKEARVWVRGWFLSIVATKQGRRAFAASFAEQYAKVMETFVLHEREPEHSIVMMTVQVFTVPSVATELVTRNDFLRRLVEVLHSVYTGGLRTDMGQLCLPSPRPSTRADPATTLVKPTACRHIYQDVKYLLQSDGVKYLITTDPQHLAYYIDFLSLFHAFFPEARQLGSHVEFETELWIAVFQVLQSIARQVKLFGEAYEQASPGATFQALNYTARRILGSSFALHESEPTLHPAMTLREVEFGGKMNAVVKFRVDKSPTSLYHPMHWLFAGIARRFATMTRQDILSLGKGDTIASLFVSIDFTNLLVLLDFPMRTHIKLAQVKCGMWVRNGTGTRGQAAHYRDASMRQVMYDQDLFLIQAGFALVASTDRVMVSYLDRFGLVDYFDGKPYSSRSAEENAGQAYDEDQERFFVEDFLLLLITLLSEPSLACGWSMEQIIRREIIHFLVMGQNTYSTAFARYIPDYMTDHPSFERTLREVANFRTPQGSTDLGIFELKDECYAEVDPYYYHYNRNQREKADEQLRSREKKAGRSPETFVKEPRQRLLASGHGPYSEAISQVLNSESYRRIIYYGLWNSTQLSKTPETSEALIDAILQLVMIGLVEKPDEFLETTLVGAVEVDAAAGTSQPNSVLQLLCHLEDSIKQPSLQAKIKWCLDRCARVQSSSASTVLTSHRTSTKKSTSSGGASSKQVTLEAKRAAAKARQAAIMKKFSAQAKTLLDSLEADDTGSSAGQDVSMDTGSVDVKDEGEADPTEAEEQDMGSCILCQEQLTRDTSFGCLGLIAANRTLRTTPRGDLAAFKDVLDVPLSLDRVPAGSSRLSKLTEGSEPSTYQPTHRLGTSSSGGFNPEDHRFGFNASTCGHFMHIQCFEAYYKTIEQRHAREIARNQPESLQRFEFCCPLCKSLGNVLLPVVPNDASKRRSTTDEEATAGEKGPFAGLDHQVFDTTPISDWLRKINIDILKTSGTQAVGLIQERDTGCFTGWFADVVLPPFKEPSDSSPWTNRQVAEVINSSMHTMLERLLQVLKPLSNQSRPQRVAWQSRTITASNSRKMYFPEELVGYTLSLLEVSQRGLPTTHIFGGNVAQGVSENSIGLLRSLIVSLRSIGLIDGYNPVGAEADKLKQRLHPLKLDPAAAMKQGLLKRLLPHWSSDEHVRSPLLLRDPLTILIEAAVIAPEYLGQVTTLMYYATLVQTVFGLAQPSIWPQASSRGNLAHLPRSDISKEEQEALMQCFPDVRWTVGNIVGFVGYARGNITLGVDSVDDLSLAKMLCVYTLPVLRRAAILRRVIGGSASMSSEGQQTGGEAVEYIRLLRQLGIPSPSEALPVRAERQSPISSIVEGWIKHSYPQLASLFRPLPIDRSPLGAPLTTTNMIIDGHGNQIINGQIVANHLGNGSSSHPTLQLEHPHVYELIPLPRELTKLIDYSQRRRCTRCREVPPDPAICLLCGELVCYQSFCCMDETQTKGECNRHLEVCGGNVGIFFKIKTNLVFLLYHDNGTFALGPYLDSHGEVDIGLQRGRPQRLHQSRYDDLRKQWLSGGIASIVARKIDNTVDVGGWTSI